MTQLMIKKGNPEILSSIRRAIENELKILELSIQKTQNNISLLKRVQTEQKKHFLKLEIRDLFSEFIPAHGQNLQREPNDVLIH